MATTQSNKMNVPVGNKKGIYASKQQDGTKVTEEGGLLIMERLGIGIRNTGATDIVIPVILVENKTDEPMTVTIPAGERWSDGAFNCVLTLGATGHNLATTYYLYE